MNCHMKKKRQANSLRSTRMRHSKEARRKCQEILLKTVPPDRREWYKIDGKKSFPLAQGGGERGGR